MITKLGTYNFQKELERIDFWHLRHTLSKTRHNEIATVRYSVFNKNVDAISV